MKEYLENLDKQILESLEIARRYCPAKPKNIQKVLFCGMGGSAISGDLLRILINPDIPLHFKVNRSAELPRWVDTKTLIILSSYSGNSVEILRNIPKMLSVRAKILIISSGGKLAEIARLKKISWIPVPGGMMPRCAIGYMTFSLLPVLKKWGWVRYADKDVFETAARVRKAPRVQARQLAKKLQGRYVHFYGGSSFSAPLLTRWRAQFAENAKMLASQHLIPEMFHNEIEGWRFPKDLIRRSAAVFFRDREDTAWLAHKIKAAQKLIQKSGASVFEINSKGKSFMARLFSLISLGDWVSYELALLNHVDPMAIPSIEALKKVK